MTRSKKLFAVAKFGGTSMADASAMEKSATIVRKNPKIKVVVVSATSGTTNDLIKIYEQQFAQSPRFIGGSSEQCKNNSSSCYESPAFEAGVRHRLIEEKMAWDGFEAIRARHFSIAKDLNMSSQDLDQLRSLFEKFSLQMANFGLMQKDKNLDELLSFGETLSAHLFVCALRNQKVAAQFFDVRQVLITDDHFGKAEPILAEIGQRTEQILEPLLQSEEIRVLQGFIGSTLMGETTTLGRGGSDFSAALIAESLRADELQIWTDVPGIMTMDPRWVRSARRIQTMSFAEAAELANFGAKVLHPATLWPAVRGRIRIFVGSTFSPESGGTWIDPEEPKKYEDGVLRAIAVRKNQILITVTSLRMLNAHGFLAKLFGVLANHRVSVDLVTTSEVSVALTIDPNSSGSSGEGISRYSQLLEDLKEFCDVAVEESLTLIALIGTGIAHAPRLNSRTFNAIAQFNIRLICHGASPYNLCFLVKEEEALEIANRLHEEFIGRSNELSS